jgi:hypothetical protein
MTTNAPGEYGAEDVLAVRAHVREQGVRQSFQRLVQLRLLWFLEMNSSADGTGRCEHESQYRTCRYSAIASSRHSSITQQL